MAFHCPSCGGKTLGITFALELPPGSEDDEITLQTLKCAACDFYGVAVYRESRQGSLDCESWRHDGYPIEDEALERIYEALLLCPKPRDRRCPCPTHTSFAQQNWVNPVHFGIDTAQRFEMRLVR
jgi:hypothetical protein